VTRLWAGEPENLASIPGRGRNFLFFTAQKPAIEPIRKTFNGHWVLSQRRKVLEREAGYSLASRVEIKKAWNCTSTPYIS
jgi:hypothetical protein